MNRKSRSAIKQAKTNKDTQWASPVWEGLGLTLPVCEDRRLGMLVPDGCQERSQGAFSLDRERGEIKGSKNSY